jgi:hypothetical protein
MEYVVFRRRDIFEVERREWRGGGGDETIALWWWIVYVLNSGVW